MSQNNTSKVQGTNTSNQNVATPSATPQKSQMVINVDAVEVKQALSVEQIFQRIFSIN